MKNDMITGYDMKGTREKCLVPALRFPEFKEEWKTDLMQSIFDIKNGYTPSKSNPSYWDNGTIPWFRMEDIRKNGHILSDSIQHVTPQAIKSSGLFPAYSIIVATTATIGEHALVIVDSPANQQFTFLTKRKSFEDKIDMMYFHHYMFIIDEWCKKNINSGGLVSVNMPAFKQLLIPYPSPEEQQKIVECLSSIDEEICTLKEKVEQLKAHKKGLLQKLFPVAGKFLPEVRFPEFKKDDEWDNKKLGDCLLQSPNYGLNSPAVPYSPLLPTYLRITDISENGRFISKTKVSVDATITEENSLHDGDIVLARTGASVGKSYKYRKEDGDLVFAGFLIRIRPNTTKYNSEFIFQYLQTDIYKKWVNITSARSGQPGINSNEYSSLSIPSPSPDEQQKIAECLSSIDELIGLYENKVTLLEQHKKGLIQQLFPKL